MDVSGAMEGLLGAAVVGVGAGIAMKVTKSAMGMVGQPRATRRKKSSKSERQCREYSLLGNFRNIGL